MELSKQEYWIKLPFPIPEDLPDLRVKSNSPASLALAGRLFSTELLGIPWKVMLLLLFSHSVVSDSWWPHRLQHTRLTCSSPSLGVCSNSCPLSWWCHPTISSSVVPFSSCSQSFPVLGSFQMSQFLASGGQSIEFQLQHHSFQWVFRTDFL